MYDLRHVFPDLVEVHEQREILLEFLGFVGIDITYDEFVALPETTRSHIKRMLQNHTRLRPSEKLKSIYNMNS